MSLTAIFLLLPALIAANALGPLQKPGETFTLEQIPRSRVLKNGPLALARSCLKYGLEIPEDVAAAIANITAATDAANIVERSLSAQPVDAFDTLYLSPITLGSDTLNLYVDTGSSDLWVFSALLPTDQQNGQALYDPTNSGTRIPRQSWNIVYGDGSGASGQVYADRVVAGEVTATRMSVEAATSVSARFISDDSSDGIMGLAFSTLNRVRPTPQRTFFDRVKSRLQRPLFTALLKKQAAGKFDFGFIDSSSFTGSISYTNVSVFPRPGYWNFNATAYRVGSGAIVTQNIPSIVDTASTLYQLPENVVEAYYAQVPGAVYSTNDGGWIFPCSESDSLPALTTYIGGVPLITPGSFLTYGAVSGGVNCYGSLQQTTDVGFSIHGLGFMRSQFVVFDYSTSPPRLGFAHQPGVDYSL